MAFSVDELSMASLGLVLFGLPLFFVAGMRVEGGFTWSDLFLSCIASMLEIMGYFNHASVCLAGILSLFLGILCLCRGFGLPA